MYRCWKKLFGEIKKIVTRDILLIYPDLNEHFDIHTDANKFQLGVVTIQNGEPIAFYSHTPTNPWQQYIVTEKELLSIVETLKEFSRFN